MILLRKIRPFKKKMKLDLLRQRQIMKPLKSGIRQVKQLLILKTVQVKPQ
jgi:hypothetical protein